MRIIRRLVIASVLLCFETYIPTWTEASENATTKSEEKVTKQRSVLMVCSTNQCRSPIASVVFREMVKKRGLEDKWRTESKGTYINSPEARWPMDKRARTILNKHGVENVSHAATPVEEKDFYEFDYMLGMDTANVEDLNAKKPNDSKTIIELLSSYDPLGTKYMRHPYNDPFANFSGFEDCYKISVRALEVFLDKHP